MMRRDEPDLPGKAAAVRRIRLRLYVTGKAPNSLRAMANLRAICAERLDGQHQIEIVDVLQEPQRALDDQVLVTPTLVRLTPTPERRVFGDLSQREEVWLVLSG